MAELVISIDGSDQPARTISLDSTVTVGRLPRCTIANDDRHLSRVHCRIEPADDGRWQISDNNSTNGTRIGETRVHGRKLLIDGDVVHAGPVRMIFHSNTIETLPMAWPPQSSEAAKSDSKAGGETILDGILATSSSSNRLPGNARKAPPRLGVPLLASLRHGRRSKRSSLSIADLSVDLVSQSASESKAEASNQKIATTHDPKKSLVAKESSLSRKFEPKPHGWSAIVEWFERWRML